MIGDKKKESNRRIKREEKSEIIIPNVSSLAVTTPTVTKFLLFIIVSDTIIQQKFSDRYLLRKKKIK